MKYLSFFALLVAMASANGQVIKNNQIVLGTTDSVNSKILNEKRKIWVHVPAGDPNGIFVQQRYPVVYLLDGDDHFASVAGMIQKLSGVTVCPDMIVVGILNTNRTRDLTPTAIPDGPADKSGGPQKMAGGGGEKFAAFIEKELMLHIDSLYPTAPYKILIGHSLGGLTAMNFVVNHTGLFNAYIVIDPSMWWDKKNLLNQAREALHQKNFAGKSLYLGIANTMQPGMDTLHVRKDTSGGTEHIRAILTLTDILKSNPGNGLSWSYRYYDEDNHGSVPLITEYDALHFLFSYYQLPRDMQSKLFDKNAKIDVAAAISGHYDDISKHFGYKVLPPEGMLNQLGYGFLQNGMPDRSFAAFDLNIKTYPDSFNVYDSMGDYYAAQKDRAKTIEFYTKALKLKEFPDTRDKLNKLLAEKPEPVKK